MPRWGGTVAASPRRCSSTESPLPRGVGSLCHVCELEGIAEKDEVASASAHREGVGERDLAGLVDEGIVDGRIFQLIAREQPGGASDEVDGGDGK